MPEDRERARFALYEERRVTPSPIEIQPAEGEPRPGLEFHIEADQWSKIGLDEDGTLHLTVPEDQIGDFENGVIEIVSQYRDGDE